MKTYNVEKFTHHNGSYSTEASDLGLWPGEILEEVGITHRSGVVTRFRLQEVVRDREGDMISFAYQSTVGSEKLHIYND